MKPIIEVKHIFKKYKIGEKQPYYSFRDTLVDLAKLPFKQKNKIKNNTFWALKDISFSVMPGEVIGIIGRNGAGKSTLLKILSRITPPTKGEVTLRGRVASLLEVGTGFHPELTGRENIYLNGAILGMRRLEINNKFDEIIEFAEISKFLDTPVKFYSSGMYMRLAFAIAAHLDPEILLVDEVLAVGDAQFQKKCLGKMKEVSEQGRTVLFVSHNMEAIKNLCLKALILEKGQLTKSGPASKITEFYLGELENSTLKGIIKAGDEDAKIIDSRITNTNYQTVNKININEPFGIEMEYEILSDLKGLVPNILISTINGTEVLHNIYVSSSTSKGKHKVICWIPPNFLNNKKYKVLIAIASFTPSTVGHAIQEIIFEVIENMDEKYRGNYRGEIHGVVRPYLKWENLK